MTATTSPGRRTAGQRLRSFVKRRLPGVVSLRNWLKGGRLRRLSPAQVFTQIYETGAWPGESRSGPGSTMAETRAIREALPGLLGELGARTMLDIPCGDFHWMSRVALGLDRYVGGDIVEAIVLQNRQRYGTPARQFARLDLTRDPLPRSDLVLCRDCLVHLSFDLIRMALGNVRRSGSTWLLTTTYPATPSNINIVSGQWRPLDLCKAPFRLPDPVRLINEQSNFMDGRYPDKSLGLWRVEDLPGN